MNSYYDSYLFYELLGSYLKDSLFCSVPLRFDACLDRLQPSTIFKIHLASILCNELKPILNTHNDVYSIRPSVVSSSRRVRCPGLSFWSFYIGRFCTHLYQSTPIKRDEIGRL